MVISFISDALCVATDGVKWTKHKWPSKRRILNTLWNTYPAVFSDAESQETISQEEFIRIVNLSSKGGRPVPDAHLMFLHFYRFRFLHSDSDRDNPYLG